jgi:hypothetical protein
MRFFGWRRKRVRVDRASTARELQAAEERLEHDTVHTIIPLGELRQENHIAPRLDRLIQKRARELRDGGA